MAILQIDHPTAVTDGSGGRDVLKTKVRFYVIQNGKKVAPRLLFDDFKLFETNAKTKIVICRRTDAEKQIGFSASNFIGQVLDWNFETRLQQEENSKK